MTTLKTLKPFKTLIALIIIVLLAVSCERDPLLHLHRENHVEFDIPEVQINLDVMWDYDLDYDWHAEWTYGWDEADEAAMGQLGYSEPKVFDLRRYYLGGWPNQPHQTVEGYVVEGNTFRTRYNFGYYDILAWSRVHAADMVQSLVFDESTLDSVMAYTNASMMASRYQAPVYNKSFNQPDELFSAYERNVHISDNLADYDSYDPETRTYYKKMQMQLLPVTYIYLTQVRLHNNNGKVTNASGDANLTGMARGVTLNSGVAGKDVVSVYYNVRFKKDCVIRQTGEKVDVAGGRCLTFGIPNQNPSRVTKAADLEDRVKHYMDVNLMFYNGMDTTMVFDVTDQVRRRYRGGVITIDLDMDTIPVPLRPGGSGFDAVVKLFDEENFYIEI
ncbi:MAG: DUF5119 domain-containing protein [Bacteroidaceae bacterium]|nr:DUF5119 domain-containing protein [Bacteroidaceae bacterium]